MKKYFYTLTIIALLLTACDKHPETRQIDWSGKERGTLTSAPMKFDTAALLRVTKSVLHGDLLFVEQETIPDNLWSLFRISGDSLHWQGVVLQKGKGTFEISQERAFILAPGNDSLVINPTGYAKNYFTIPAHDPAAVLDTKQWGIHAYPETIGHRDIMAPTTDGGFITVTRDEKENMFEIFFPGDSLTESLASPYPETDQPLVGTFKGYAYNGRICQRPGYDQYLHVGSTGRMAAVFELENKRIVRRKEIYNKLPEFELAPDGMNLSPSGENDLGFRFAVSENYIYLCPIPFKLKDLGVVKDYKGYPLGYADDLQIFDWNGNPVCRYELDTPVVSLTVAPDESHLYANTIDPETEEPRILRFALPSLEH
ncbi:hypothetical protein [Rikenella microfusus]|uniref:hypothetical protein n=1 Tax=Rikenella microfusus TaxID=28139 RepID=UPI003AB6C331